MPISRRTLLVGSPAAIFGLTSIAAATTQSATSLNFLAVGDWGKSADPRQREVAMSMGRAAREFDCRFVISTGDNFYARGVSSIADPLWETAYEHVYTDDALLCPWYPVLGNHDHKGNTQAQIDYSRISSRWTMPANYYRRTEVVDGYPLVEIFFLDTTPLADGATTSWIKEALAGGSVDDQYQWLEVGLRTSRAKWKIVVGHHPIYSGGPHHISHQLVQRLKPLLSTYGVIAYLNGHDHNLQHIIADHRHFLTCGSGSQTTQPSTVEGSRFAAAAFGFMRCELTPSRLDIEFIGADGRTLYQAELGSIE
ncbi:MAG: purple acid phosphatase family protein [Hyphomicrobium sp.]